MQVKPTQINVTSNVQDHLWSGIASHVERNYQKDSNSGINPEFTKYNEMLSKTNLKPAIEKHFKDLVKKHDSKYRGTKHANRCYGSVHNYLAKRKGVPESTIVLKIGRQADKQILKTRVEEAHLLSDQEAVNKVKRANNYAFKLYVRGYKQRHPLGHSFIPMGHAETNEDEAGADHLHYNIADLGFTPKGNASMGFSRAVCNEYHINNRLKAMKLWHHQEDPAMLNCMNKSYQELVDPSFHFTLKRTGKAYHLGQNVYKHAMAVKDQELQRLEPAVNSLIGQNDRLKKENQKLLNRLHQAKICNSGLQRTTNNNLMILGQANKKFIKNNNILKKHDDELMQTIDTWNQYLPKLKSHLRQLADIVPFSTTLKKLLYGSRELSINKIAGFQLDSENLRKKQKNDSKKKP